jgi:hypothetical protein
LSNDTRCLFGGSSSSTNVIQYITTATTGNATDFGDLSAAKQSMAATSNSTRGVFAGGYTTSRQNVIEYVTIATTGNTTDFGDLTEAKMSFSATSGT